MVYSLARFRTVRPTPPFRLGGIFATDYFLTDAFGLVRLDGDPSHFGGLADGDLIVAEVSEVSDERVVVTGVTRVTAKRPGFRLPHRPLASRFARFTHAVREYFLSRGLSEVFTPTIVTCPGLEPSLEPFATNGGFLPTSPEISLKKALASGWTDVFEIKSVFRRGENSPAHAAEFFMLEWYRGFADLDLIESDLRGLLASLTAFGEAPAVETTDFRALFASEYGFDLRPNSTLSELTALARRLDVETAPDDTFADVFNRIMVDRLEAVLASRGPTIVRRFPPSMAALAKLDGDGWADRMEFYWRGFEIANGFNEVSDAREQAARWDFERAERARLGTSDVPGDPELIDALAAGSPPAGGIALGVERLFMAMTSVERIRELRLF